mmetsp:Transcript_35874/g.55057  ORF Transcript_35874/g.55057 Transcript_35874/m.55057 type:complete len:145 (-) Transcript_35874:1295-1729(-)
MQSQPDLRPLDNQSLMNSSHHSLHGESFDLRPPEANPKRAATAQNPFSYEPFQKSLNPHQNSFAEPFPFPLNLPEETKPSLQENDREPAMQVEILASGQAFHLVRKLTPQKFLRLMQELHHLKTKGLVDEYLKPVGDGWSNFLN